MTWTVAAPPAVLVLWWIALGLTVVVIVPLALVLLHRTWRAARNIQRYSAEALEAASGIAGNTALLPALDETIDRAGPILEHTAAIRELTAAAGGILRRRANLEG